MKLIKHDKNIIKTSFSMALPSMLEMFFVSLAGLIDTLMVSSLGSDSVAAVGLTNQPKFISMSVFMALNVSVSALVARRFGEKKRMDANTVFTTAFAFMLVMCVIISFVMVYFADFIIEFCGSTPETHADSVMYFRIIMLGLIFTTVQMCINSAQRGCGNTKITMRTNVTANAVNMVFNYLLIGGKFGFPALGVKGAAIATVFGYFVSCIMSIISVLRAKVYINIPYILKNKIYPRIETFVGIIKIGYSFFLEQLLMRIGFMFTALMAADQGMDSMAAHQVVMNILSMSFAFGDGLQTASVALIGRSLGEKNPDKAWQYGNACQFIGGVISVILVVIYLFGGRPVLNLFFKEKHIVDIGVSIMYIAIFTVLFQVRQIIYMGCLRGAGDTFYTAMSTMIAVTIIRTVVSYLGGYVLGLGIVGIWLGILADQVFRLIFSVTRYKKGKWVSIKI